MQAGETYGCQQVVAWAPPLLNGKGMLRAVLTVCVDCGKEKVVSETNLRKGRGTSCQCAISRARKGVANYQKHGLCDSPTYGSWSAMLSRCNNPNDTRFKDYGGRGIRVCDRWKDFRNFLADMGLRPDGKTLDREDVNGNYEPDNCRWADSFEQAANKRRSTKGGHCGPA